MLYLQNLASKNDEEINRDRMIHLIVAARAEIHSLVEYTLWDHIEQTLTLLQLVDIQEKENVFAIVIQDLVKNKHVALGAKLAIKLSESPQEFSTGLSGWKFVLDRYLSHEPVLNGNSIYRLASILPKAY